MYPNIFLSMSAELPNKFKINTQYTYQKMGAYLVAGHLEYAVAQCIKEIEVPPPHREFEDFGGNLLKF